MVEKIKKVQLSENSRELAIYDFCQTLVDFETADEFIHFIRQEMKNNKWMNRVESIRRVLYKIKIIKLLERLVWIVDKNYSINKRIVLLEIKRLKRSEIEIFAREYYRRVIKPHLIKIMTDRLKQDISEGRIVVIVSAAYTPYLNYFARDFGIHRVIANDFIYDKRDRFTGRIRKDCKGKNKVSYLMEKLPDFRKYKKSIAYGDSESDYYILSAADEGFVVSHMKPSAWNRKYGFEEVIWR